MNLFAYVVNKYKGIEINRIDIKILVVLLVD